MSAGSTALSATAARGGRRAALHVDGDDVAECVDAGVGAPCHRKLPERPVQLLERPPQLVLDRPRARLAGPAPKARAVVLERQLQARHVRPA